MDRVSSQRRDPDALLAVLQEEARRGKLTVFLGATAGVGKTYTMLETAHERRRQGVDVVAGWVETHGRPETEALLQGLPAVPPRTLTYKGRAFREMDLEGILARRPQLVLVDELAHTNVPGSRHAKRYLDVEEILAEGIDVYTTLNIQHLESLNDVVAKITGVAVRETVPDRLLETAYQVHLVDVPPDELLQRLREGKVYLPEVAERAVREFFRPGNLHALRELALRYTAQKVDRQVEAYMRSHAIDGPWPAGERVMVCVSPSPFSAQLIRVGRRMAAGLKAPWLVAYVEQPGKAPGEEERLRISKYLRLAEELGAETVVMTADRVAEELVRLAKRRNVTQIIIGKPLHSRFGDWMRGSLVDRVIRSSEGIRIHVIPGKSEKPANGAAHRGDRPRAARRSFSWDEYGAALGIVAAFTALLHGVAQALGLVNIALVYLFPVLFSAVRWSVGPAAAAAVAGVLAFDFFFVPPVYSFTVADLRYALTFAVFLAVAVLTGRLADRLRRQVETVKRRETQTAALYALSRQMTAVTDLDEIARSIAGQVAESADCEVALFLPDETGKLAIRASSGSDSWLSHSEEAAVAEWVYHHGEPAGRGTQTLREAQAFYLPVRFERQTLGVLGVRFRSESEESGEIPQDRRELLHAFTGLAAAAVARVRLGEQAKMAEVAAESERLRTALLNSITHDLRTPLASMIGSVTSLLEGDEIFTAKDRRELLTTIYHSALRMNRLIANLLDMARIESGMMRLNKKWCDLEDVIGVALSQAEEALKGRDVRLDLPPDIPLVRADDVLLEQVLVNLLGNAAKFSPAGSPVGVGVTVEETVVEVSVTNRGPGIPPEDLDRVFEKFYRSPGTESVTGTGLGLAISKAIIEAHGGRIWAANVPEGTRFAFALPVDRPPGSEVEPKGA
ncbi:MAG: sensor histidine kinase KdpD [Kyrpidia sp.]|nr:sensor histidine kinase KdpD [Kyrpidia sp.]